VIRDIFRDRNYAVIGNDGAIAMAIGGNHTAAEHIFGNFAAAPGYYSDVFVAGRDGVGGAFWEGAAVEEGEFGGGADCGDESSNQNIALTQWVQGCFVPLQVSGRVEEEGM